MTKFIILATWPVGRFGWYSRPSHGSVWVTFPGYMMGKSAWLTFPGYMMDTFILFGLHRDPVHPPSNMEMLE